MKIITKKRFVGGLLVVALVLLGLVNIGVYPGAHYDELLFVNATQRIDETFIHKKYGEIPIMLMSYIGALKSYLFMPIFIIFGVSLESIRIPIFILGLFCLLLIYILLSRILPRFQASIITFLIGFNPYILYQFRVDVGPVVLELLIFISTLLLTSLFITDSPNSKLRTILKMPIIYWFLFSSLSFLGVFNKLHYLWIVNAFIFAHTGLFFLNNSWKDILKIKVSLTRIVPLLFIVVPYLWVAIVFFRFGVPSLGANLNILSLQKGFLLILDSISGVSFYQSIFGYLDETLLLILRSIALCITVIGVIVIYKQKTLFVQKKYILLLLVFVPLVLQFFLTSQARAPWHTVTITVLLVIIISIPFCLFINEKIQNRKYLTYCLLLSFFAIYTVLHFMYQQGFTSPIIKQFSPRNLELIEYTKSLTNTRIYSVTWGIHTQFIAFDPIRGKYKELIWDLENKSNEDIGLFIKDISNDSFVDYFVTIEELSYPGNRLMQQISQVSGEIGLSLTLKHQFYEGEKIIYEVYELFEKK